MKKTVIILLSIFLSFSDVYSQESSLNEINTDKKIIQVLDLLESLIHDDKYKEYGKLYTLHEKEIKAFNNPQYTARLNYSFGVYNFITFDSENTNLAIDKAIGYFEQSKDKNDIKYLIHSYNVKALSSNYEGFSLEKRNDYYKKAIQLYENSGMNINGMTDIYFNYTFSNFDLKNWTICLENANKTISLTQSESKLDYLIKMYYCKGYSELKLNRLDEALVSLKKSERLVEQYESITHKKHSVKNADIGLYELYKMRGEYDKALKYLEEHLEYIKKSTISYEEQLRKKVQENKALAIEQEKLKKIETESKLKETQLAYNRITIIFSISAILVLIYFLLQQSKLKKINLEKNSELTSKNNDLETAKIDLENALLVKVDFLNSISHELKTPLYAINSIAQLMKQNISGKIDESYVDVLTFSGNHLLRFINEVIETNIKGDKNELVAVYDTFDMTELIKNIKETLSSSLTVNNNNTYDFKLDKNISQLIKGDTLIISRIIINLINNASKNTENGNIKLEVNQLKSNRLVSEIEFSVIDTGRGISEKQLEEIYLSLNQNLNIINRVDGFSSGLGMGLVMVNRMLKLFNSELIIETQLGKGSTFKFVIVFENELSEKRIVEVNPKAKKLKQDKSKVLVVDDNKINQLITSEILSCQGINCDIVSNGYKAIERIEQGYEYQFVLMDIMMPELDGYETTKIIKSKFPDTNIVALTAISVKDNLKKLKKSGFDEVITKPFELKKIAKIIDYFSTKNQKKKEYKLAH